MEWAGEFDPDEFDPKKATREMKKRTAGLEGYVSFMPKKSKAMSGDGCSGEQVEQLYPAIAQWVRSYGHIEVGDQDGVGFIVRALDYGGLIFEDDKPTTLAESMTALEKALSQWFEEEGVEIET